MVDGERKTREKFEKATKGEVERRVRRVYELLLTSHSRAQILQDVTENKDPSKNWGVEERQIDEYISRAQKLIEEEAAGYQQSAFGTALARLNMMYQHLMRLQSYAEALNVQKEINKLLALYKAPAPQTIRIEDVREQAVADIRAGRITYPALVEALNDTELANDLFRRAGVAVEVGQSAASID